MPSTEVRLVWPWYALGAIAAITVALRVLVLVDRVVSLAPRTRARIVGAVEAAVLWIGRHTLRVER